MDERKITIIEGPPPTFELSQEDWAYGMVEGPSIPRIATTKIRALNGPSLVERCYRAWKAREPIHLEFRNSFGEIQRLPIVAAHYDRVDDMDMLRLWVAIGNPEIEITYEISDEEDFDEGIDDDEFDGLGFFSDEFDEEDDEEGDESDLSDIDPNDLTLDI